MTSPRPPPLSWSAIAISPAHCGAEAEVPPTSYQPVLHGALPHCRPPFRARERHVDQHARSGLACSPMSGTPRELPTGVLPAGSVDR